MSDAPATRDGRDAAPAGASSPALAALVAAFQHVTIGMAVRAPDSRLIDVNPAYARMLGYERDELLALDSAAIAHPEDQKMRSVDCNSLVRDVAATFRPLTDSRRFSLDLDPSLHPIDGDRERLAQEIAGLHGGRIWADSELGLGSTFYLAIPAARSRES